MAGRDRCYTEGFIFYLAPSSGRPTLMAARITRTLSRSELELAFYPNNHNHSRVNPALKNERYPNPYAASAAAGAFPSPSPTARRRAWALVWILSLVAFTISFCTFGYIDGRFCEDYDPPNFLDWIFVGTAIVALTASVLYPATAGRRILHFFATLFALFILLTLAMFFSMAFLGYDIMD